tara:strand:+ start:392 stop:1621 length:1230 start_codon:yes stop_codon:yes gene_type:complete
VLNNQINNYFLFLFCLLPISIIAGSSISLTNILLIDISFLIFLAFKKELNFLKSKAIKYLLLLYIYLIFNSFISIDYEIGLARNLGFIRFIILFVAFNYFFNQKSFLRNTLYAWSLIIVFILFDIFYESYIGKNIIGFGGDLYRDRIVSFFKDEPIVGGYIYSFYLIILGFLFHEFNQKKNFIVFFSIIFLAAIILTGERSNTLKAFLAIFVFYSILREFDFKKKIIFFVTTIIVFSVLVLNSQFLKVRFVGQIQSYFTTNNLYFNIYKSGFEVYKNYKFFGVGNKNYRVETCQSEQLDLRKKEIYYCTTHPHQIYFEFLSEHGLFGTIFLFFIFYQLIFSRFKEIFKKNNYVQSGSFIYLMIVFVPLLPGGAFFGDYMLTMFMLNLSIFYSSNQSLNIFNQNGKRKTL